MAALNLADTHCILGWVTDKLTWRAEPARPLLPEGKKTITWMIVGHLGRVRTGGGVTGGGSNRREAEAGRDFHQQHRENEMSWRGREEHNVLGFHYKNRKILLMTKYWALWNKILDHITSLMVSHFASPILLQAGSIMPLGVCVRLCVWGCVCLCISGVVGWFTVNPLLLEVTWN